MHKTKFNKRKCATCKYRRKLSAGNVSNLCCNYSSIFDQTCLHVVDGKVQDRRGDKYNNCKLYVEGEPVSKEYKSVY